MGGPGSGRRPKFDPNAAALDGNQHRLKDFVPGNPAGWGQQTFGDHELKSFAADCNAYIAVQRERQGAERDLSAAQRRILTSMRNDATQLNTARYLEANLFRPFNDAVTEQLRKMLGEREPSELKHAKADAARHDQRATDLNQKLSDAKKVVESARDQREKDSAELNALRQQNEQLKGQASSAEHYKKQYDDLLQKFQSCKIEASKDTIAKDVHESLMTEKEHSSSEQAKKIQQHHQEELGSKETELTKAQDENKAQRTTLLEKTSQLERMSTELEDTKRRLQEAMDDNNLNDILEKQRADKVRLLEKKEREFAAFLEAAIGFKRSLKNLFIEEDFRIEDDGGDDDLSFPKLCMAINQSAVGLRAARNNSQQENVQLLRLMANAIGAPPAATAGSATPAIATVKLPEWITKPLKSLTDTRDDHQELKTRLGAFEKSLHRIIGHAEDENRETTSDNVDIDQLSTLVETKFKAIDEEKSNASLCIDDTSAAVKALQDWMVDPAADDPQFDQEYYPKANTEVLAHLTRCKKHVESIDTDVEDGQPTIDQMKAACEALRYWAVNAKPGVDQPQFDVEEYPKVEAETLTDLASIAGKIAQDCNDVNNFSKELVATKRAVRDVRRSIDLPSTSRLCFNQQQYPNVDKEILASLCGTEGRAHELQAESANRLKVIDDTADAIDSFAKSIRAASPELFQLEQYPDIDTRVTSSTNDIEDLVEGLRKKKKFSNARYNFCRKILQDVEYGMTITPTTATSPGQFNFKMPVLNGERLFPVEEAKPIYECLVLRYKQESELAEWKRLIRCIQEHPTDTIASSHLDQQDLDILKTFAAWSVDLDTAQAKVNDLRGIGRAIALAIARLTPVPAQIDSTLANQDRALLEQINQSIRDHRAENNGTRNEVLELERFARQFEESLQLGNDAFRAEMEKKDRSVLDVYHNVAHGVQILKTECALLESDSMRNKKRQGAALIVSARLAKALADEEQKLGNVSEEKRNALTALEDSRSQAMSLEADRKQLANANKRMRFRATKLMFMFRVHRMKHRTLASRLSESDRLLNGAKQRIDDMKKQRSKIIRAMRNEVDVERVRLTAQLTDSRGVLVRKLVEERFKTEQAEQRVGEAEAKGTEASQRREKLLKDAQAFINRLLDLLDKWKGAVDVRNRAIANARLSRSSAQMGQKRKGYGGGVR